MIHPLMQYPFYISNGDVEQATTLPLSYVVFTGVVLFLMCRVAYTSMRDIGTHFEDPVKKSR